MQIRKFTPLLMFAVTSLTGCVVFPAPNKPIAGNQIQATRLQFIKFGVTTGSEVIKELGSPNASFDDIRVIVYSWDMRVGYVVVAAAEGYRSAVGVETLGKRYVLLIELDEQDHVRRFEITTCGSHDTKRSRAVAWAKEGGNSAALWLPSRFVPIAIPPGKSVIHIYRPGGFEVPFVAVQVSLKNRTLADLRSKECVSVVTEPGSYMLSMYAHSLSSGSGFLSVDPGYRIITVTALPDQASYAAVTVPAGHSRLDPCAKILAENEAMPTLIKLKP